MWWMPWRYISISILIVDFVPPYIHDDLLQRAPLEQLRGDEEVAAAGDAAHAHQAHQARVAQLRQAGRARGGEGRGERQAAEALSRERRRDEMEAMSEGFRGPCPRARSHGGGATSV